MRCCYRSVTMLLALTSLACADDGNTGGSTQAGETRAEDSSGSETSESGPSSGSETSGDSAEGDSQTDTQTEPETSTETGSPEPFCGDGNVDPGEACDDGNDNPFDGCLEDCTAVELLDPPPLEWEYIEVPGTRCMDGSPAGFGVNYNPESSDVMIYLEGGGACFSDACDFTAFSLPFLPPSDGIFSRGNNSNPVRNWTMIYVPYCTGDIHAGDAEAELGGQLRQFRGYSNITTYLQQWVPSFSAERVLLTGISAGGFGAALNTIQVREAYGEEVELTVIDDSGPPLSNGVIPPCLQEEFRATWNLDDTVLADCPNCAPDNFATDLIDHVINNYPEVQFGLFSNTADQVIRTYMGAGWSNGQYDNCDGLPLPVPALTYSQDLDDIRTQNMDDISTFYVLGIGHTALRVGFNLTFAEGTPLSAWIGDVIDGQLTHVGP